MMSRLLSRSRLALVLTVLIGLVAGCGETPQTSEPDPEPPTSGTEAEPAAIQIDGDVGDWTDAVRTHTDPEGDGGTLDLRRLRVASDATYLFLQMDVAARMNLQEGNDLTLYLDTDADASTGRTSGPVGADVSWSFGERTGVAYGDDGSTTQISHADLGFTSLPTVRSDAFEIALNRAATPAGQALVPGDSVRVVLEGGGDRLPDGSETVSVALAGEGSAIQPAEIGRTNPDAVRFLSYNVLFGRLFEAEARPAYERLLAAMQPDVLGFQEIYDRDAEATRQQVADLLDAPDGGEWHAAKAGPDLVAVSRYSITATHEIPGYRSDDQDYDSGAFLLDTGEALGGPTVFVLAHPPCCNSTESPTRDEQRQIVVDGIAAFVRDVQQGEGPFDVPENTPIVVAGDMNFVGSPQQPQTLRTGEIINTDRFGPSAAPDWDGSDLLDTNPRQVATPIHATWDDPESSFPPGRLDYTYVSDSVLDVANEYVLHTPSLSDSVLSAHGLQADDSSVASDHLPVVVDVVRK
jgi:endonuclease/exonuclease/phosphatase family metal-dependent hydrolase